MGRNGARGGSEEARLRRRIAELERLAAERQEAGAALADSEARFRSLVENMRGIVFYRGEPDGEVRLYGADVQEIAGTLESDGRADLDAWYAAIHPDDIERYRALEQHRRLTGEGYAIEFRFTHPITGELVWALERAYTVVGEDGRRYNDGTIIDITAEKARQEELRQASETATIASRSKSEFLANMSHELRTPLNAIIGFAEIILDPGFPLRGTDRTREYCRDIHSSATHLLRVIEDILDVSKAEAGKLELTETLLAVDAVIASAVRMVEDRAAGKGIAVEAAPLTGLPRIRADERKLRQILLNLLSNAVKFTPPGGAITVGARRREDGGVTLAVADTGIGMDEEDIPRAFEPFVQLHAGLGRQYEGTGLGLPLCRKLTELHGGRIVMESEPGAGTVVSIHLPPDRSVDP
jgi:PAS domain S-box-containing protein